jgi:hypothetical protein
MWKTRTAAAALVSSAAVGCAPTATYHYTVRVTTPPHSTTHAAGLTPTEPEAVLRIEWANGVKEIAIPNAREATTVELSERLAPPFNPVVGPARGLSVRLTKDGYKPWQGRYKLPDFISVERDELRDNLFRADVVLIQPVSSTQPSTLVKSVP